jgi:eukaryotic-like serine/threonine-protein kinase
MKKELKEYLQHQSLIKNIFLGIGILIAVLLILLIYLRIYTHHNRSVAVPDFTDLPVDVASKLTRQRKLRYEIFDSVFISNREKGVVIDQHPKPGFMVKKHRKIYFTINANSPEKMLMPDLVGITLREARTKIDVAGLKLGRLTYRFDMAKNVVLEQQFKGNILEPGDTIFKGSAIDLVLGKGLSDEKTMVPDLIGMTLEYARDRAADAFFTIGTTIPDQSIQDKDTIPPRVYRQHPAHSPAVLVPLGSQITLWVSIDTLVLNGLSGKDSTHYAWPELNDADHDERVEDDNYDYDYTD